MVMPEKRNGLKAALKALEGIEREFKKANKLKDYEVALKTLEARAALDGKIKEFEELRPRFNEILRRIGRRKRV